MSFSYVSEVLGVKKYLCPKNIWSLRHIKGNVPCDVLVLIQGEASLTQQELLKKILSSVQISSYTILELKDLNMLESAMRTIENNKWTRLAIGFGQDLSYAHFKHVTYLKTYFLKELEGAGPEIQSRKKQLWSELKKWNA
ncbi:MAG: hypothetical protein ACR2M7_04640 [Bdellovibrionales bacterium]